MKGRKDAWKGSRSLLAAPLLLCTLASALAWSAPAKQRPNLLVVTIDTLRADHLGCYGDSKARTPTLDKLAREGVRFKNGFSAVPLTLPSHCTIFTGTYPIHHGVRDNSGYVLSPRRTTLAEVLKSEGYQTGAFVGAFVLDSKFGLDQGFDTYYDNFDLSRFENVSPGYIQRPGDEVVARALEWLSDKGRDPFFLWVHFYDPHDPYTPPEPYASRHRGDPYAGEIEFSDHNLGTLLGWLGERGLMDRTVVAVVGDHGESLGEHGELKHGLFTYDATLRVPFLVRLPEGLGAGRVVDDNVSLVDLMPTLLQLVRVDRSGAPEIQGRGLAGLVLGKGRTPASDLYAESFYPNLQFGWSPLQALISGDYKYILAPHPELYNLRLDPAERNDLAGSNKVLAGRLKENLEALTTRFGDASADDAQSRPDAETLEKLQSLGYVALSAGSVSNVDYRSLPDPKERVEEYKALTDLFELSSLGRYKDVIPGYLEAVKKQPSLKIAWYKLGQAYFFTGDFGSALESFQKAIELGGEDALATFDLAQTYLKLNRPADAILGFERTIAIDPSHYRARTNLGVLFRNQGKVSEAIDQLEKAVAIAPGSIPALGNLGVCYSMASRHQDAVDTLRKAVALAPDNALLHANLATVFQRMGKPEEARKEMETARRLNPKLFQRQR